MEDNQFLTAKGAVQYMEAAIPMACKTIHKGNGECVSVDYIVALGQINYGGFEQKYSLLDI